MISGRYVVFNHIDECADAAGCPQPLPLTRQARVLHKIFTFKFYSKSFHHTTPLQRSVHVEPVLPVAQGHPSASSRHLVSPHLPVLHVLSGCRVPEPAVPVLFPCPSAVRSAVRCPICTFRPHSGPSPSPPLSLHPSLPHYPALLSSPRAKPVSDAAPSPFTAQVQAACLQDAKA